MALSTIPCRNTNFSASKWQFRWRMLFYRGDKLQVSLVALGERFRAARQFTEWEPELWLTAAPDCVQSPRSAALTNRHCSPPMDLNMCSECPTHFAPSSNDDYSLEGRFNHPFFILLIILCNEMMNDVVSPSRMATQIYYLGFIQSYALVLVIYIIWYHAAALLIHYIQLYLCSSYNI